MVSTKPGGTGKPAAVISPRLAPLPPTIGTSVRRRVVKARTNPPFCASPPVATALISRMLVIDRSSSCLSRRYADAVAQLVTRKHHDLVARLDSRQHFRQCSADVADAQYARLRSSVAYDERRPLPSFPLGLQERAARNAHRIRRRPNDDARFDAESIPDHRRRCVEVYDHIDALLLHAERRNFRKARRLYFSHAATEPARLLDVDDAGPLGQPNAIARVDGRRVARQHVDDNFQRAWIANLDQGTSGCHDALAAFRDAK